MMCILIRTSALRRDFSSSPLQCVRAVCDGHYRDRKLGSLFHCGEREDCEIDVKTICGFSQFDIFGEDTGHRHWIDAENFQLKLIESCVDLISDHLQESDANRKRDV